MEEYFNLEINPKSDMWTAIDAATAIYPATGRRWYHFLKQRAKWTQDAIEIPHVWTAIESLADRLETVQTMQASTVHRIINDAIGDEQFYSLGTSDPKWRKRFWGH